MPSPEYDLGYLQAGIRLLEKYLLATDIYWPIRAKPPAGEPPYPQLTLSGLLLAQSRLQARSLSDSFLVQLRQLEKEMDGIRSRWRVAWEAKASHEFHARLLLWRDFLEDYRSNPRNNVDRYAYEVSRRVMLHLLVADATQVQQTEIELLEGLDKLLRAVFVPGEFVWDPELAPGYPLQTYWYLYGRLREFK